MNGDLKKLTQYPEFYALKVELDKFRKSLDDISDLSGDIKLEEIYGRRIASQKVEKFLFELGLIERNKPTIERTYE